LSTSYYKSIKEPKHLPQCFAFLEPLKKSNCEPDYQSIDKPQCLSFKKPINVPYYF
jgi:hypothetical protein